MSANTAVRIHRVGLALALLALWLVWMSDLPELALWLLFGAGLAIYAFPVRQP